MVDDLCSRLQHRLELLVQERDALEFGMESSLLWTSSLNSLVNYCQMHLPIWILIGSASQQVSEGGDRVACSSVAVQQPVAIDVLDDDDKNDISSSSRHAGNNLNEGDSEDEEDMHIVETIVRTEQQLLCTMATQELP
ncbi:hypothetical protein M422DRAFT_43206 [Sphaerobolus stellatus SS14]|nr:hypothetical protein M422DRAFT_43206 [Sphaerobolus stellatus SS14]